MNNFLPLYPIGNDVELLSNGFYTSKHVLADLNKSLSYLFTFGPKIDKLPVAIISLDSLTSSEVDDDLTRDKGCTFDCVRKMFTRAGFLLSTNWCSERGLLS